MVIDGPPTLLIVGEPLLPLVLAPDFQFTLTGSRYFGNDKPTSDWDFIAQDSPPLRAWLADAGFTDMGKSAKYPEKFNGLGSGTSGIFQKKHGDITAQVQLSHNAVHKIRVRDLIKQNPDLLAGHGKLSRNQRHALWSSMYETLALAS